jgi:hypothetical protein
MPHLRAIGAGLARTGTTSLKLALERLLGGPCYHMREVFAHPPHIRIWADAAQGNPPDWRSFLSNYVATVDEPAACFWPELVQTFPKALVILSIRDPQSWWQSLSETIMPRRDTVSPEWRSMVDAVNRSRLTADISNRTAAIAAFERHYDRVREGVSSKRLLEWSPEQGWAPLCNALGCEVPRDPFPHLNTRADWN